MLPGQWPKGETGTLGGKRIMTVAALAMGWTTLGSAPALADGADDGSKAKKDDTSRRVCRMVVPTGSRMSGRICRTQAEWDAAMDKSQDNVLRHQSTKQTLLQQAPRP